MCFPIYNAMRRVPYGRIIALFVLLLRPLYYSLVDDKAKTFGCCLWVQKGALSPPKQDR